MPCRDGRASAGDYALRRGEQEQPVDADLREADDRCGRQRRRTARGSRRRYRLRLANTRHSDWVWVGS